MTKRSFEVLIDYRGLEEAIENILNEKDDPNVSYDKVAIPPDPIVKMKTMKVASTPEMQFDVQPKNQETDILNYSIEMENYTSKKNIQIGRRIINVSHFLEKINEISNHGPLDCGLSCIELVGEKIHDKSKKNDKSENKDKIENRGKIEKKEKSESKDKDNDKIMPIQNYDENYSQQISTSTRYLDFSRF
ncbi:unnamed protein product [Parnassius apollo]|uniref:(apollo) hypothetical protein n=1 Tax=Parnassius apollo TaxID=110799 RepID=A0A8S3W824_PARAO|nr:unnamed protein product [Parnassius apollo]